MVEWRGVVLAWVSGEDGADECFGRDSSRKFSGAMLWITIDDFNDK